MFILKIFTRMYTRIFSGSCRPFLDYSRQTVLGDKIVNKARPVFSVSHAKAALTFLQAPGRGGYSGFCWMIARKALMLFCTDSATKGKTLLLGVGGNV